MRILYISQYFPPEIGATQVRAKENVLHLRELGHSLTVMTEMPNHPQGIIQPPYRGKWVMREKWQGIPLLRVWVFARPQKHFLSRIFFYLSFMIMGIIAGTIFLHRRYDIVYASSPPFFVGLLGWYLSRIHGSKFVFEVRDLWPRSAVELGELRQGSLIRLAEKLEQFYYRRAALVVAVTRGIYDKVTDSVSKERLFFLPNGANTKTFRSDFRVPPELAQQFAGQFVVSYTGVIGLIHDVETVIDAANLLQHHPDIVFLIIGDGVKKQDVVEKVQKLQLQNVCFLNAMQEIELVPYILISRVALATVKKMKITLGTLPVKMFSAMACARPVVLAAAGEAADLLTAAQAGIVVEPGNPPAMATAILQLYRDPDLVRRLGQNGRQFVEQNYDRGVLAASLHQQLMRIVPHV